MRDEFEERPIRPPPRPSTQKKDLFVGYVRYITIGILLLIVGYIIFYCISFIDDPNEYEYTGDNGNNDYQKDYEKYNDIKRPITATGSLLSSVGLMILSFGLILGAITDDKIPANARLGMLIAVGLIFGIRLGGLFL